jgi:hypothetical protein
MNSPEQRNVWYVPSENRPRSADDKSRMWIRFTSKVRARETPFCDGLYQLLRALEEQGGQS